MSKRKPPMDEKTLEFFRRIGRKGGKAGGSKGGKRSLETMTKAARIARAYQAGIAGGRPREVDRDQVVKLRRSGKSLKEVAAKLNISISTVCRIMREAEGR